MKKISYTFFSSFKDLPLPTEGYLILAGDVLPRIFESCYGEWVDNMGETIDYGGYGELGTGNYDRYALVNGPEE